MLKLLQDTSRQHNMTVVVVTHNQAIAPMADKVIKLKMESRGRVNKCKSTTSGKD